jgi:phosphonate transport system ATP-binding protein
VLVNLHHLDTARAYCDRIIAMHSGRVMFDGVPAELTAERVAQIYGVSEAEFHGPEADRPATIPMPAGALA